MSKIKLIDTPWGKEAVCAKCGSDVYWEDCWNCEEGYSYHDCGEDTCCCIHPQPNVICDICNGEGGWYVCLSCVQSSEQISNDSDKVGIPCVDPDNYCGFQTEDKKCLEDERDKICSRIENKVRKAD